NEAVNQVVTNVVSAFPGRILRKASPRAHNFLLTEVVVADALATGYVADNVEALTAKESFELSSLLKDVVVVATTHTAVRRGHETGCNFAVFTLAQHWVRPRASWWKTAHQVQHLGCG